MNSKLSQQQIDDIKQSYREGYFSMETHVEQLAETGFSKEAAEQLVSEVVKNYREELFQSTQKSKDNVDIAKIALFVAVMVSLIGPLFSIESTLWYMVAVIICGAAGHFGTRNEPVAGTAAGITFALLFPVIFNWYLQGRSTIIKIEILIPIIFSALPAVIIWVVLAKLLYSKKDQGLENQ